MMQPSPSGKQSSPASCPDRPVWLVGTERASPEAISTTAKSCPTPLDIDLKSREVAALAWLGILVVGIIVLAVRKRELAGSLLGVLRALFHPVFIRLGAVAATWIVASVALLAQLDLWRWDNLKTTVVWALTFVPVSLFEYAKAMAGKAFVRRALVEIAGATVFVQFLVNEYTFSLWLELILIPILVFVALLQVVAQLNPEHKNVERLTAGILAIAGFSYLGNAVLQLIGKFESFASYATARELFTPVFLSICFLPIVYLLAVYASYETALMRLNWAIEDDRVRGYARWRAFWAFRLNLEQLRRWSRDVATTHPKSRSDVRASILVVKRNAARERHAPPVFLDEGWSPHVAKAYLKDEGLDTGDYHAIEGEWFASSPMLELGAGIFPDNIAYYVEGDERAARCLKLALNINNPAEASASLSRFGEVAAALLTAASGLQLTAAAAVQLARLDPAEFTLGEVRANLSREQFLGALKGYRIALTVKPSALVGASA